MDVSFSKTELLCKRRLNLKIQIKIQISWSLEVLKWKILKYSVSGDTFLHKIFYI